METTLTTFQVIDYSPEFKEKFKELNLDWMRSTKMTTPQREAILNDPESHIINKGGTILFAEIDSKIVGCCALIRESHKLYEIADMAVTPAYQGKHIGKSLLQHVIEKAKLKGAKQVYVIVNKSLKAALEMYQAYSFREVPLDPEMSEFSEQEVKMILNLK